VTDRPFGANAAEEESQIIRDLYFTRLAHHREVLDPNVALILGRRGAGKTALGTHLQYSRIDNDVSKAIYNVYVDVSEPKIFTDVIAKMQRSVEISQGHLTETVANLWRAALWVALANEVAKAPQFGEMPGAVFVDRLIRGRNALGKTASSIVRALIQAILQKLGAQAAQTEKLADELASVLADESFVQTRKVICDFLGAGSRRAAIVIDTLEEYRIAEPASRTCIAALVHAACVPAQDDLRFPASVEIKCFLPAELYAALEPDLLNIGKYEGRCHYMHWRRKDLLRMICWRYLWYREHKGDLNPAFHSFRRLNWGDYETVRSAVWDKLFPAADNHGGTGFDSFSYITRYTQLRPRQLIWLCNEIANNAPPDEGFDWQMIRSTVAAVAPKLASEVLNAFREVYPNAFEIVQAMAGAPEYLTYGEVEERAHRTKAQWPERSYDRHKFWRLIIETGMLGVVERRTEQYTATRYEYIVRQQLAATDNCKFAIHPMFHRYLNVSRCEECPPQYPLGPDDLKD
jgi:hypothetical protein